MDAKTRETISHNARAFNAMQDRRQAMHTATCPKCGGEALPALLETWGHCFACQKASQADKYGFGK